MSEKIPSPNNIAPNYSQLEVPAPYGVGAVAAEQLRTAIVIDGADDIELESRSAELTKMYLDRVRGELSTTNAWENYRGSKKFDDELQTVVEETHGPGHVFMDWKQSSEQAVGKELSWLDWLGSTPEEGGTTDEQLTNVLQWNEYRYRQINNDPRTHEQLRNLEANYSRALESVIKADKLSPALMDAYEGSAMPKVFIGDSLNKAFRIASGYADKDFIVMSPQLDFGTYAHERTHHLGGLGGLDEGAVDIITQPICEAGAGSEAYEIQYSEQVELLNRVLSLADLDKKEISYYFAHNDVDGFFDVVNDRSGMDISSAYNGLRLQLEDSMLHAGAVQKANIVAKHFLTALRSAMDQR